MATEKINKGHYHEAADRLSVEMDNIENNIIAHAAVCKDKKVRKLCEEAQAKLMDAYQIVALKM